MADTFEQCVAFTLTEEGGYSDNPADAGGPTNFGITQATLSAWRGYYCTAEEVENLSEIEAEDIYESHYWNTVYGNVLPIGVDLLVFDFGVNTGPSHSVKMLQNIVGVKADGMIGPISLLAMKGAGTTNLINSLSQAHTAYYQSLADFSTFGNGWLGRVQRAQSLALSMVSTS
jgi:lysozyme family protein